MANDYIYKARIPIRIGLSLRNQLLAKLLVTPVLGLTISKLRGVSNAGTIEPVIQSSAQPLSQVHTGKIASLKNQIGIYTIDEDSVLEQGSAIYIYLDFIPVKLDCRPGGNFKPITVLGRNNPNYHYGGGEDSMQLEIDWYAYKDSPLSVIQKCRMIEALTKADGWVSGPPLINFQWGINNPLFENHMYLVEKAPYTASQFLKQYRIDENNTIQYSMQPMRAKQTLHLKRVTNDQLTHAQIVNFKHNHLNP